jgi:hypothetical protein
MAHLGEFSPVSQIAGRLLIAWRSGHRAEWIRQFEIARRWAARSRPASTLEMERLEVLSGALESLGNKCRLRGAIGLLEQLAGRWGQPTPAANGWPLLSGQPAVLPCSRFVQ